MICPECKENRGCGCQFVHTNKRDYKVCPDCKTKLESQPKANKDESNKKPNVQGV